MPAPIIPKGKHVKFWVQKVLPAVYDDALSYMEVLAKLYHVINDNISRTNELIDFMQNLDEFFEDALIEFREELARTETEIYATVDGKIAGLDLQIADFKAEVTAALTDMTDDIQAFKDLTAQEIADMAAVLSDQFLIFKAELDADNAEFKQEMTDTLQSLEAGIGAPFSKGNPLVFYTATKKLYVPDLYKVIMGSKYNVGFTGGYYDIPTPQGVYYILMSMTGGAPEFAQTLPDSNDKAFIGTVRVTSDGFTVLMNENIDYMIDDKLPLLENKRIDIVIPPSNQKTVWSPKHSPAISFDSETGFVTVPQNFILGIGKELITNITPDVLIAPLSNKTYYLTYCTDLERYSIVDVLPVTNDLCFVLGSLNYLFGKFTIKMLVDIPYMVDGLSDDELLEISISKGSVSPWSPRIDTQCVINFDNATAKMTTPANYEIMNGNTKYVIPTPQNITIPTNDKFYYIYFDTEELILELSDVPIEEFTNISLGTVNYNGELIEPWIKHDILYTVDGEWDVERGKNSGDGTGGSLPPSDCYNIMYQALDGAIAVRWNDSIDFQNGLWNSTVLVRKVGSYPINITDGDTVVTVTNRDEYSVTTYNDGGLTNGIPYYYKLFPISNKGLINYNIANNFNVTPMVGVPPTYPVENIIFTTADNSVSISWTDPADHTGVQDYIWASTTLRRKLGGYPLTSSDGEAVVVSTVRSQYTPEAPFVDTGVTNGTAYFYKFFPVSTLGDINNEDVNNFIATPLPYTVPLNCTNIITVPSDGQVSIRWTDPAYDSTYNNWLTTVLVRKLGSYPTSVSDGDIVVSNSVRNYYQSTAYVDTGLTNMTTYYYKLFPISDHNKVNLNPANNFLASPQPFTVTNNVTNLNVKAGNNKLTISWTDPADTMYGAWGSSVLVRGVGRFPTSVSDGVVLATYTTKNMYSTTGYLDDGLINDQLYYYKVFPISTAGLVNSNPENNKSGTPRAIVIFGIAIDENNPNPNTAVTYTDDAVGMTPRSNAWDSMPIFNTIRPCVFNGTVQYYLNPNNYNYKEDGTQAVLTGADGDVMVEIQKFGWKFERTGVAPNTTLTIQITDNPEAEGLGFAYPMFTRLFDGDKGKIYIGAYLSKYENPLKSVSNISLGGQSSLPNYWAYSKIKGNAYSLPNFYTYTGLAILGMIRAKTISSTIGFGTGVINPASFSTGYANTDGMWAENAINGGVKIAGLESMFGFSNHVAGATWIKIDTTVYGLFTSFTQSVGNTEIWRETHGNGSISRYISKTVGTNLGCFTTFWNTVQSGTASSYFTTYQTNYYDYNSGSQPISLSGTTSLYFGLLGYSAGSFTGWGRFIYL